MRSGLRRILSGIVLVMLAPVLAYGQAGSTAQIAGFVRDTTGGVLPGADVTAIQAETGLRRTVITDATVPTFCQTCLSVPIGWRSRWLGFAPTCKLASSSRSTRHRPLTSRFLLATLRRPSRSRRQRRSSRRAALGSAR